jgi:hypothetical protein
MTAQVACAKCGKPVSARIARRMKGLCLACLGRETTHTRKGPFYLFYNCLIERVHNTADGFGGLSEAEKLYWAVALLRNEINNGGFTSTFSIAPARITTMLKRVSSRWVQCRRLTSCGGPKRSFFQRFRCRWIRKSGETCSPWWNQTLPTLNGNVSWTNSTNVSMQIPTILLRGWKLLPASRDSFQTKQTEIVDAIRRSRKFALFVR